MLKKFSKLGYKNLYGYDLGVHYKKFFKDSNIKFIKNLKEKKNYYNLIIFSHTIAYTDDIEKLILLTKKGLSGVIIGKAIYESRIKIKDLIMLESRI